MLVPSSNVFSACLLVLQLSILIYSYLQFYLFPFPRNHAFAISRSALDDKVNLFRLSKLNLLNVCSLCAFYNLL